ncbi:hypothetical protein ABK040_015964 [Willaertia magna]
MTDFSLNDFLDFSSTRKYFTIKNFEEAYNTKVLSGVEEKIKQQLMIILYKFIIYSDDLFTIKEGKEELYEMIDNYVIEREKVQDEILGITILKMLIYKILTIYNKRKVTKKEYTLTNYFKTFCLKYFGKFGPKIYKNFKHDLEYTIEDYKDKLEKSINTYNEEDEESDSDEDDTKEIENLNYKKMK